MYPGGSAAEKSGRGRDCRSEDAAGLVGQSAELARSLVWNWGGISSRKAWASQVTSEKHDGVASSDSVMVH